MVISVGDAKPGSDYKTHDIVMDSIGGKRKDAGIKPFLSESPEKEKGFPEALLEKLPKDQTVNIGVFLQCLKPPPVHHKHCNLGIREPLSHGMEGRSEEECVSYSGQGKDQDFIHFETVLRGERKFSKTILQYWRRSSRV